MTARVHPKDAIGSTPMSPGQWRALATCVLVNAVDGFDILAISFAAPGIASEWHVTPSRLGLILSIELIGMALGSLTLARLADAIGRRAAATGALCAMSVTMGLSAVAGDLVQLGILRLLTGISMGTLVPALTAMAAESVNYANRDRAVSWMGAGYPLGAIVGGAISSVLLASYSWRAVFVLGSVVSALALLSVLRFVPETVSFLDHRRPRDALRRINQSLTLLGKPGFASLPPHAADGAATSAKGVLPRNLLVVVVPLTIVYFLHMCSFYYPLKWLPKIAADMGYNLSIAASGLVALNIGGAVGSICFGFFVNRLGLTRMLIGVMVATSVALWIFGFMSTDLRLLVLFGTLAGIFSNAGVVGFYALVARSFPELRRATGAGLVLGMGRGAAALAPILTGYLFQSGLGLALVSLIIGSGSVTAAAIIALTSRSRATVMDHLTKEQQ